MIARNLGNWLARCGAVVALLFAALWGWHDPAVAIPASKPKIVTVPGGPGEECRKISTGGVDHGKEVAQKYADDLLAGDLKAFKKQHKIKHWEIRRRFRLCKYHLWFFGDEYNCTSGVVVCWPRKAKTP